MIKSMTGFGKAMVQLPTKKITIELKSLNSKNLDINARIPAVYKEKELGFRNTIAKSLERGKIDFSLYIEHTGEQTSTAVNNITVKNYMQQLKEIVAASDIELLQLAIKLPDTLKVTREEINDNEFSAIEQGLEKALLEINTYREEEGSVLAADFTTHLKNIETLLEKVIAIDPERLQGVRVRLEKAVADLNQELDQNRFEQELIYYLEKFDITEEKVRLANHLTYFKTTLTDNKPNGKKLGFICQEIGREINTMGSKSNYAPMQKIVVEMKDALEKIKEQILNVL